MSSATKNLENDHVQILRLIEVMDRMVESKTNNSDHLKMVAQLIANFADEFHHAKEEKLLFPLMVKKGFSENQGPIAVMLSEHEMGRSYRKELSKNIELLEQGKITVLPKIYVNMKSYTTLLRNHISKEDNILFKMADQTFNTDEQNELLTRFSDAEQNIDPEFNTESSKAKIDFLISIYNL
jgi:hemerythrin-like domain-containing protein